MISRILFIAAASFCVSYGYVRVSDQSLFIDSNAACQAAYGTDLASIHSNDDYTAAVDVCGTAGPCWLGGNMTDRATKTWSWLDGSLWDFEYWGEFGGVPQGQGLTGEYYTCVWSVWYANNGEGVQDCGGAPTSYYPVCNDPPTPEPTTAAPTTVAPTTAAPTGVVIKYQRLDQEVKFIDSNAACQAAYGTDLASIHSIEDYTDAVDVCGTAGPCWLGGNMTDRATKTWSWLDGTLWNYEYWGTFDGVPQGQGLTGEYFTCIWSVWYANNGEGVQDCGDVETYYPICNPGLSTGDDDDAAKGLNVVHIFVYSILLSVFYFFSF